MNWFIYLERIYQMEYILFEPHIMYVKLSGIIFEMKWKVVLVPRILILYEYIKHK